eukprot:720683-Pelagomonas_calceolata.AAC.3
MSASSTQGATPLSPAPGPTLWHQVTYPVISSDVSPCSALRQPSPMLVCDKHKLRSRPPACGPLCLLPLLVGPLSRHSNALLLLLLLLLLLQPLASGFEPPLPLTPMLPLGIAAHTPTITSPAAQSSLHRARITWAKPSSLAAPPVRSSSRDLLPRYCCCCCCCCNRNKLLLLLLLLLPPRLLLCQGEGRESPVLLLPLIASEVGEGRQKPEPATRVRLTPQPPSLPGRLPQPPAPRPPAPRR